LRLASAIRWKYERHDKKPNRHSGDKTLDAPFMGHLSHHPPDCVFDMDISNCRDITGEKSDCQKIFLGDFNLAAVNFRFMKIIGRISR
jgi:hypothetical protein